MGNVLVPKVNACGWFDGTIISVCCLLLVMYCTFLLLLGDSAVSKELEFAPPGNFGLCDKLVLLSELSVVTRANFCKKMRLAL